MGKAELRKLYNEELDDRVIDLLQSGRLSEEDYELVNELGTRFIQQRQDKDLIEKNLKSAWDDEKKLNMQICGRIDMQESIIKMFIREFIYALRNGQ